MKILLATRDWSAGLRNALAWRGHVIERCSSDDLVDAYLAEGYCHAAVLQVDASLTAAVARVRAAARAGRQRPVIATGRGLSATDRSALLGAGAHDVLPWPLPTDEVEARVVATVRRAQGYASSVVRVGALDVDLLHRVARVGEQTVPLSHLEFALLEVFVLSPGQTVSRDRAAGLIYSGDEGGHAIDRYLSTIRAKVRALTSDTLPLRTHYGQGWRFEAQALAGVAA